MKSSHLGGVFFLRGRSDFMRFLVFLCVLWKVFILGESTDKKTKKEARKQGNNEGSEEESKETTKEARKKARKQGSKEEDIYDINLDLARTSPGPSKEGRKQVRKEAPENKI